MSDSNKSYRIKTNVGSEYNGELKFDVNLLQDYDEFEILSLKIGTESLYKYHTSHYGCIVGRVLANGGVGVPNVKISSFIPVEDIDTADPVFSFLYPYTSTRDKNRDDIRYNLLTDTKVDDCHQVVGTFPNKRLVLDDNNVIEIYDKYYKFTTTTNGSGDYMLFGLPVGNNIIHSDLDLSDIGFLSQKPRDLFYKGYTEKQFENASQFKKDTNLDNLTQVISQDSSIYVFPFWGDEIENEGQIKIVRNDIDVNYKFEPTCIFIGCIVSDEKSNAISKNCIPHERMGKMDRLTTGAGTIEMIRKTISGDIESITIQGNNLIDGNGTWCYQIPMNLDYMSTDEYGNLVPTDDYNKGLPTRTSVRFRVSLADYESDYENAHLVKVLVPNNPGMTTVKDETEEASRTINYDYEFGSATQDSSFRDMFWNNVYTVKSYIPRFQKGNRQKNRNFTGFKAVNVNGSNNPIPYNNMRINLTFLFVFQCLIFKSLVLIVKTLNKIIYVINLLTCGGGCGSKSTFGCGGSDGPVYLTLDGGMCPTLEGNFISPGAVDANDYRIIEHTYANVFGDEFIIKPKIEGGETNGGNMKVEKGTALPYDPKSADGKNSDLKDGVNNPDKISKNYNVEDVEVGEEDTDKIENLKIYNAEDYFVKCVELQFAMEYEVIQFDFYNDWINGMIYIPRWFAEIRKNKDDAYYCGDNFAQARMLTQQCAIAYNEKGRIANSIDFGSSADDDDDYFRGGCRKGKQQCHKRWGRKQIRIFGKNRGIVTAQKNSRGQYAYYLRPNELMFRDYNYTWVKVNLFATDIVLLGSVLDCNQYGIPKVNGYTSSSYRMPPPLAEIVSDTQNMEFDSSVNPEKGALITTINAMNKAISNAVYYILSNLYTIEKCDVKSESMATLLEFVRQYNNNPDIGSPQGETISFNYVLLFFNKLNNDAVLLPNYMQVNPSDIEEEIIEDGADKIASEIVRIAEEKIKACRKTIFDNMYGSTPEGCNSGLYNMFYRLHSNLSITTSSDVYFPSSGDLRTIYDNTYKMYKSGYDSDKIKHFYDYIKKTVDEIQLDDEDERTYAELSGIDWGYNPFKTGDNDNTTWMGDQNAGHFLEIGCTYSLSNIKSCVNLQRVCEIGGEISQSHYYYNTLSRTWNLLDPSGIIAKREVIDAGIRSSFATLNSKKLGVMYDTSNGYKKYDFISYNPVSFMGDLENRQEIQGLVSFHEKTPGLREYDNFGLIETQSLSYRAFRFNTTGESVSDKFLIGQSGYNAKSLFFMPQYENSFYFYFGLRDGNTAIDRLYTEYYAPCDVNSDIPEVTFTVEGEKGVGFRLHYSTQNMSKIKSVSVRLGEYKLKIGEDFTWDKKKSVITVPPLITPPHPDKYTIRLKDTSNQIVKSIVICRESDYKADPPEEKSLLVRKYLTYDNKWLIYFKPVNCKITSYWIDNSGNGGLNCGEDEWHLLGGSYFPSVAEDDSTHSYKFYDGKKLIYSDRITFNEKIDIENIGCESNLCTIKYTPSNFFVDTIESESVSNVNYVNKTFSIAENTNSVVIFKNSEESVIIERTVDTINQESIPEPDDEYNITLHTVQYANEFGIYYKITPLFTVNKIYVNDIEDTDASIWNNDHDYQTDSYADTGSVRVNYRGMNKIVFENNNGDRLVRYVDTNFDVNITSVNYEGNVCKVSYEQIGFEVSTIYSDKVYDNCNLKGAIYDLNTNNKTFKIYNGYNDQNGTDITIKFINNDESIEIMKQIQTNPTAACKTCPYDPSDT